MIPLKVNNLMIRNNNGFKKPIAIDCNPYVLDNFR